VPSLISFPPSSDLFKTLFLLPICSQFNTILVQYCHCCHCYPATDAEFIINSFDFYLSTHFKPCS
jgi:hypothetical protein